MDVTLDLPRARALVESYSAKTEMLIESYAGRKEQLIGLLQDIQAEFNYLPQDVLVRVSQKLDVPLSQVFGVATFFRAFTLRPRGRHVITVCRGTACHIRAGERLVDALERKYELRSGETSRDLRFTLETVNCLGCCALGPVIVVDGKYEGQMTPEKLDRVLSQYE